VNYRKGVSPIISVVLLIAIVLSVAVVFTDFLPNLMSEVTSDTSDDAQRVSSSIDYGLDIRSAKVDRASDTVKVDLKNTGDKIEGNITITVFCRSEAFQKQISNFSKGKVERVKVEGVNCEIDNIRASVNDYPVSDEEDSITVEETGSISYSSETDFENAAKTVTDIIYAPVKLAKNTLEEQETSTFSGSKENITVENGVLQLAKE
jgi:flagellin-like protein